MSNAVERELEAILGPHLVLLKLVAIVLHNLVDAFKSITFFHKVLNIIIVDVLLDWRNVVWVEIAVGGYSTHNKNGHKHDTEIYGHFHNFFQNSYL